MISSFFLVERMLDCFEALQERGFEVLSSGVMDEGRACNCCVGFCFLGGKFDGVGCGFLR